MRHAFIPSKMKKGRPLMEDPLISRYVPDTDWFHAASFDKMLKRHSTVYIKPDKGSGGNGVIRVKRLSNGKVEISHRRTISRCSTKQAMTHLRRIMKSKDKYLIQQGIDLATYHHRPFDVRVVLQKPFDRWQLNWMSAKVAPRSNSVVTNVAQGATDMRMNETLRGVDQPMDTKKVRQKLREVSHMIARKLGSRFPLKIVGLDMGIDKKGKVWFIEANTRPNFRGLEKLDYKQYQKYLEAKKLTGVK